MFGYLRGHKIEKLDGKFVYSDTKEITVNNNRPCGYCGLPNTSQNYDGCLGKLPKIMNACCGHGQEDESYLQYWDGSIISGKQAIKEIERLKKIYTKYFM